MYKKILLEDSVDRTANSPTWGTLTADTFYVNIMLTQTMDNMGIFTDISYLSASTTSNIPDYTILEQKLSQMNVLFPFMTGDTANMNQYSLIDDITLRNPNKTVSDYYNSLNLQISAYTDSKIEELKSYSITNPYQVGFDIDRKDYYNYLNNLIHGVNRISSLQDPNVYVFDTPTGSTLGQPSQTSGLQYVESTGNTRIVVINGVNKVIPVTQVNYIGEGFNMTNTSLSGLTKEEYLFGSIFPPEVKSDVFIDRGVINVTDKHLRLSEVKTLNELARYGNGFYRLNK
jgi:hypothetical protein